MGDFLLDGVNEEFESEDGWNIEKMKVMLVTKSKTLVKDLDWDEEIDYGRFRGYNFEVEDILGEDEDGWIRHYSLTVEREYDYETETEKSLLISMMEWESEILCGEGQLTDIRTLMQN